MQNFENLKKRAKLVLKRHRDGYHPVAAQIRAALPRYRDLSDAEILAAGFKLADAQDVVAREAGFESWLALKSGSETMTPRAKKSADPQSAAKPVIVSAEPQLFVVDIGAACDFYVEKLGFSVVFTYGEPAFYAQVVRDGARLNLRHVDRPVIDGALRNREDLLSVSLTVATSAALKSLFREFEAAGAVFHRGLKIEPWGARDFIVKDLDGNLLLFAGPDGSD